MNMKVVELQPFRIVSHIFDIVVGKTPDCAFKFDKKKKIYPI